MTLHRKVNKMYVLLSLTISNIRSAGFSTMDLRDAGLTIEELLKEVTVHELVRDGWSSRELRQAGVTWKQIVVKRRFYFRSCNH